MEWLTGAPEPSGNPLPRRGNRTVGGSSLRLLPYVAAALLSCCHPPRSPVDHCPWLGGDRRQLVRRCQPTAVVPPNRTPSPGAPGTSSRRGWLPRGSPHRVRHQRHGRHRPLPVLRCLLSLQLRASFSRWFALLYIDKVNERADDMFEDVIPHAYLTNFH
ncbi:hypothetical protein ACQ4PT_041149 [Festuca glaucescens]